MSEIQHQREGNTVFILLIAILVFIRCAGERQNDIDNSGEERIIDIQQAWQGDFSVEQLSLLPENQ